METLRQHLINWNVAPLSLVVFFCYIAWRILERLLDPSCEVDVAFAGVLATALAGILLYLSQMYNSIQRNRGHHHDQNQS
jgi:hypothetical protein